MIKIRKDLLEFWEEQMKLSHTSSNYFFRKSPSHYHMMLIVMHAYKYGESLSVEELKTKQNTKTRLIGLDLGTKRIGVSICDEYQKIATPFTTIENKGINYLISKLKEIIRENNITGIIIGNPLNMDGSYGKASQSVNDISKNISKSINIDICLWDERLSTVGAFNITSQLDVNVSKREKNIDQNAATFILQGAIDFLNN